MPRMSNPIPEVTRAITRPVTLEVAKQLIDFLRLPAETKILLPAEAEQAPQPGSKLGDDDNDVTFGHGNQLRIEASERYLDDQLFSSDAFYTNHRPIFLDRELDVALSPVYAATELTLSCTFRAASRTEINRFRDDAVMRAAQSRRDQLLVLDYHYTLPEPFVALLRTLYDMQARLKGSTPDFKDWAMARLDRRATELTTLIGTSPTVAIAEKQHWSFGMLSFIPQPDAPSKEKESGTYTIGFEFRVQYDKPIAVAGAWPLVIANRLIEPPYRYDEQASGDLVEPNEVRREGSYSRQAMDFFTPLYDTPCDRALRGAWIPAFDDWWPDHYPPGTVDLITIMLQVDESDPRAVIDLKQLGEWQFDPDILQYLKGETRWLGALGTTLYHLALYDDTTPMEDGSLTVDEDLVVRVNFDLNPMHRYHLRIGVLADLFQLPGDAKNRLCEHGKATWKALQQLQYVTTGTAWLPDLIANRVFPADAISRIAQRIANFVLPSGTGGPNGIMQTVGQVLIVTHRREPNADHDTDSQRTAAEGSSGSTDREYPNPVCDR